MKMAQGKSGVSSNPVSGDFRVTDSGEIEVFDGVRWLVFKNSISPTGPIVIAAPVPKPSSMKRKYIVAGTYDEYKRWLDQKGFSKNEYVYVSDANVLRGIDNPHGFYVGSWEKRKDINDISLEIRIRQR